MKKLVFIFCVLFSVFGEAQTWTQYTIANTSTQLPQNGVNAIAEDNDKSLWFGTNEGVSHYNGVTWKNYFNKDKNTSKSIRCITIDSYGNKWFGTNDSIIKFDGNYWTSYTTKELVGDAVTSIAIDEKGNKWIGTYSKGVFMFDDTTWVSFSSVVGLNTYFINDIFIDKKGNKWIATKGGGAYKFDNNIWTNYHPIAMNNLPNSFVNEIIVNDSGNVWFATNYGISMFDGYKWTPFEAWYGNNNITSISIDNYNNIITGNSEGFISKFDGKEWTPLRTETSFNNLVNKILIDSKGNLWTATSYLLSMMNSSGWTEFLTKNSLANESIYTIEIDNKGNKWFGGGLTKFDDKDWQNFPYSADAIGFDKVEKLWVCSKNGIFMFDNNLWTKMNSFEFNNFQCIEFDADGNCWIGHNYYGILKFDGISWTIYNTLNGLSDNNVYSIAIDQFGKKWIGTNNGVSCFDGVNWINYDTKSGLAGNKVYSVAIDAQGNKWFGTDEGLSKFNGVNWTNYSESNGLPYKVVSDLVIDSKGIKWCATGFGVSKFNDTTFVTYKPSNGLNYDVVNAIAIDNDGNKWFGTNFGVSKLIDGGAAPLVFDNILKGIVFHDLNANGKKDPNETTISGQIVRIDNKYTTTQNNGLFYTSLNNGSHTFTYRPQANWKLTTDSSITISVNDTPIKDTLYFGVQAIANKHEVETKLTGTATRAGFESKSWINYSNLGTLAENGTVSYTLADEASLVQTIPVADSVIGRRLVWKYNNLIPNEQRQISITTQMPGVNSLGDTLVTISKIKSAFAENSDTLKQVLTGSYDPNDKLVAQGIGSKGYVLFGKELEYTVRFQNTGTDTAFNVNIRDTLDLNLDVASLQIVASSHPVKLDLRGQNEATFRFENILLPDSNVNQLGSNGFVKYTIRPKKNLPENTSVKNKAHIYFDFNPAIITNETENTYVSKLPSVLTGIYGFQSNKSASIFPNPAKDEFTIVFPQTGNYEVSLANIQGKNIRTWNEFQGIETTLSLDGVEPGMYLYTAQSRNGQKYMGKVVVR